MIQSDRSGKMVTQEMVRHVAQLARLQIHHQEIEKYKSHLKNASDSYLNQFKVEAVIEES